MAGWKELSYFSGFENKNAIALNNRVETMSNRQNGAVFESVSHCVVHEGVGLTIDSCSCFVHQQNLRTPSDNQLTKKQSSVFPTLLCRRRARAMQSSCRSPTEKFSPFSMTKCSSWLGRHLILSFMLVRSRASQIATSVYFSNGSKLYLLIFLINMYTGVFTAVIPNCSDKKNGVLRDNRELRAQVLEADLGNVDVVDFDDATVKLDQSKKARS